MMRTGFNLAVVAAVLALSLDAASAQTSQNESIPFADGSFTISQKSDFEKTLSFGSQELASNYVLSYDRTVEVSGTEVALFDIGPGGNACGTSVFLAWMSADGELQTAQAGDDCGSPPAAIGADSIYFVPYLIPGDNHPVQQWSPDQGLRLAGTLEFTPQPGTSWGDINPDNLDSMLDALSNEAVYKAATNMLKDELPKVTTGLSVTDGVHRISPKVFFGSGCVPHACGEENAFMAIDQTGEKLYFAQQDGENGLKTWPETSEWPGDVKEAMTAALAQQ